VIEMSLFIGRERHPPDPVFSVSFREAWERLRMSSLVVVMLQASTRRATVRDESCPASKRTRPSTTAKRSTS
jgi:hypothetical protein